MPIVKQIMILTKDGLLLFEENFQNHNPSLLKADSDLFSGFLSAILSVAKETSGGSVQTISQNRYKVIVSEGTYVYVLLFIDEESRELENIARQIVGLFENKYQENLIRPLSDTNVYDTFTKDLENVLGQIFQVDAELISKLIPEISEVKDVAIYEKPMNHQVYSGPRTNFLLRNENQIHELVINIIEAQAEFSAKTAIKPKQTIVEFKDRTLLLEDLGTHVIMFIDEKPKDIQNKLKNIRKKIH
jgi:hypothetical protein